MARMMLNTDGNFQPAVENAQEPVAQEPVVQQPVMQQPVMQEPVMQERRRSSRVEAAPAAPAEANEDRYAHMFADWDLLPPQVLIRRINRKA